MLGDTHFFLQKLENYKARSLVNKKPAGICAEEWTFWLQWASQHTSQRCEGRFTHSHTGPHFIKQSGRQNCSVTGQWCVWTFKVCIVKWIISVYVIKIFKMINFFRVSILGYGLSYKLNNWSQRSGQFRQNLVWRHQSMKKSCGFDWDFPLPYLWFPFCPTLLSTCWLTLVIFWKNHLLKTCEESTVMVGFFLVQQYTIYRHQDYEQKNFYKKSPCILLVGPSETRKSELMYSWLRNVILQTKTNKLFFINTPSHFTMLCKRYWETRTCSRCKLWVPRFVRKQR